MESNRSGDVIREQMLAGVLGFVRAVAPIVGIRRIALIGSIVTTKPTPKDVDLLVTVADDADLALLAQGVEVQAVAAALEIHPFMLSPMKRFQALQREHALLQEEHALLNTLIRFSSARKPMSSHSSTKNARRSE